MPKLFEVNTHSDVLCYIPSGKITQDGQQQIQFKQDGGTCWFYASKKLANAMGLKFTDSASKETYELISAFRKTQSRLDSAVTIASGLIVKKLPRERVTHHDYGCIIYFKRNS